MSRKTRKYLRSFFSKCAMSLLQLQFFMLGIFSKYTYVNVLMLRLLVMLNMLNSTLLTSDATFV